MFVAAVTGTDGKTTVVEFARQLLDAVGRPAASYGTLGLVVNSGRDTRACIGHSPGALRCFAKDLARDGREALALGAYSSPLGAGRLDDARPDVGVLTGIGRDHLDIHGTEENYFAAKTRLFETVLPPGATAVVNADTPRRDEIVAICRRRGHQPLTYGQAPDADLRLVRAAPSELGMSARISILGHTRDFALNVVAGFTAENALAAAGIAVAAGADPDDIASALEGLDAPPGRVEQVAAPVGASVYLDHARTPGALAALLGALRERTRGRVILVFGRGGDRDAGKWPEMGAVASALADIELVTEDNPRREDPRAIRASIQEGCPSGHDAPGRGRAIARALSLAAPGDSVVVAGKGHEVSQILADRTEPWSDRQAVRAAMRHPAA